MSNLYGAELAKVFDKMYRGFIDYGKEYQFYASKAKMFNVKSILELGCGSGNLAHYFIANFDDYLGIDLSTHMLELACKKNSAEHFKKADMRSFSLQSKYEMACITGRSSSYLLSNTDLTKTFNCITKVLKPKGHLVFDCIDAEKFVPYVKNNPTVIHYSTVGNLKFHRSTHWYVENQKENLVNWKADYFKQEESKEIKLGQDHVIFKAFKRKNIVDLLNKSGYDTLYIEDRPSYAFDTFVIHAQKMQY